MTSLDYLVAGAAVVALVLLAVRLFGDRPDTDTT